MLITSVTLNNGKNDVTSIEKEFDRTRSNYLRDLDKLRKRYARRFLKLSNNYSVATLSAQE